MNERSSSVTRIHPEHLGRHASGEDKAPDWRTKIWEEPATDEEISVGRHQELPTPPTARQRLGELLTKLTENNLDDAS